MAFTQSFNLTQPSFKTTSSTPLHPPHLVSFSPSSITFTHHQHSLSTLSRRLFVPSVSGLWDAITGGNSPQNASAAVRRGMALFRQGDVAGSVVEFDRAIQFDPRQKAYLWQRGLSLYYLDRFKEGAEQFRLDVAQNPNDTEESIWCFLCEAQLYGVDEARKRFLEVGRDSRPVMREAYNIFKEGGDPEQLVAAFSNGRDADYFYALDFTTKPRKIQMVQSVICLLLVSHLMHKGLMITWLQWPRFIVPAGIGAPTNRQYLVTLIQDCMAYGQDVQVIISLQ